MQISQENKNLGPKVIYGRYFFFPKCADIAHRLGPESWINVKSGKKWTYHESSLYKRVYCGKNKNNTSQPPDDPQIPQADLRFASRKQAKQQQHGARAQHKTTTLSQRHSRSLSIRSVVLYHVIRSTLSESFKMLFRQLPHQTSCSIQWERSKGYRIAVAEGDLWEVLREDNHCQKCHQIEIHQIPSHKPSRP